MDKLAALSPPLWLTTLVAAAMAAALLFAFVDTLHEHLRHGDELRRAQMAAAHAPVFEVVVDATTASSAQQVKLR